MLWLTNNWWLWQITHCRIWTLNRLCLWRFVYLKLSCADFLPTRLGCIISPGRHKKLSFTKKFHVVVHNSLYGKLHNIESQVCNEYCQQFMTKRQSRFNEKIHNGRCHDLWCWLNRTCTLCTSSRSKIKFKKMCSKERRGEKVKCHFLQHRVKIPFNLCFSASEYSKKPPFLHKSIMGMNTAF